MHIYMLSNNYIILEESIGSWQTLEYTCCWNVDQQLVFIIYKNENHLQPSRNGTVSYTLMLKSRFTMSFFKFIHGSTITAWNHFISTGVTWIRDWCIRSNHRRWWVAQLKIYFCFNLIRINYFIICGLRLSESYVIAN